MPVHASFASPPWRDQIDVTLPAGYAVDDLPAAIDLDLGFAHYKSGVKVEGNTVRYTNQYVVREFATRQIGGCEQLDGFNQRRRKLQCGPEKEVTGTRCSDIGMSLQLWCEGYFY